MKKLLLAAMCVLAIGVAKASECKNCGCDTRKVTVYQCKKCRTFFCGHCMRWKKGNPRCTECGAGEYNDIRLIKCADQ